MSRKHESSNTIPGMTSDHGAPVQSTLNVGGEIPRTLNTEKSEKGIRRVSNLVEIEVVTSLQNKLAIRGIICPIPPPFKRFVVNFSEHLFDHATSKGTRL